ncbi:hypothetical protein Hanom_Chr07g00588671 [Helianthus anomalus]
MLLQNPARRKVARGCCLFSLIHPDYFEFHELINEDDKKLKTLKAEWGIGIFDAVVAAFMELNEYNPNGRYEVNELWNFNDNKKSYVKGGY